MFSLSTNNLFIALIIIFFGIIIWLIFLQIKLRRINRKNEEIFSGTDGQNLEEALHFYVHEVKKAKAEYEDIKKFCKRLNSMSEKGLQKVGLLRFNPFSDTGGDQSFAIAFLDHFNNGIVVSSLHGREGTRIYAKPIMAGKSKYNLSAEEIKAIEKAIQTKLEE